MTVYINEKTSAGVETIDEFETDREAREMLAEYQMAYHYADVYISTRCTSWWRTMEQKRVEAMNHKRGIPDVCHEEEVLDSNGDACWQELVLS